MMSMIRKERKVVRQFREAGATSAAAAKTLDELQLRRGVGLRRLRERAVIRESGDEHYYLDDEAWTALRHTRRRAALVTLAIVLLIVVGILGVVWVARR